MPYIKIKRKPNDLLPTTDMNGKYYYMQEIPNSRVICFYYIPGVLGSSAGSSGSSGDTILGSSGELQGHNTKLLLFILICGIINHGKNCADCG